METTLHTEWTVDALPILTNNDWSRTDNHDFFDIIAFWHLFSPL